MNNKSKNLEAEIISLKEMLYSLIKKNSLTDKKVVKCSIKLDKLILEYQKLKRQ
jgi:hypothetical protein